MFLSSKYVFSPSTVITSGTSRSANWAFSLARHRSTNLPNVYSYAPDAELLLWLLELVEALEVDMLDSLDDSDDHELLLGLLAEDKLDWLDDDWLELEDDTLDVEIELWLDDDWLELDELEVETELDDELELVLEAELDDWLDAELELVLLDELWLDELEELDDETLELLVEL